MQELFNFHNIFGFYCVKKLPLCKQYYMISRDLTGLRGMITTIMTIVTTQDNRMVAGIPQVTVQDGKG